MTDSISFRNGNTNSLPSETKSPDFEKRLTQNSQNMFGSSATRTRPTSPSRSPQVSTPSTPLGSRTQSNQHTYTPQGDTQYNRQGTNPFLANRNQSNLNPENNSNNPFVNLNNTSNNPFENQGRAPETPAVPSNQNEQRVPRDTTLPAEETSGENSTPDINIRGGNEDEDAVTGENQTNVPARGKSGSTFTSRLSSVKTRATQPLRDASFHTTGKWRSFVAKGSSTTDIYNKKASSLNKDWAEAPFATKNLDSTAFNIVERMIPDSDTARGGDNSLLHYAFATAVDNNVDFNRIADLVTNHLAKGNVDIPDLSSILMGGNINKSGLSKAQKKQQGLIDEPKNVTNEKGAERAEDIDKAIRHIYYHIRESYIELNKIDKRPDHDTSKVRNINSRMNRAVQTYIHSDKINNKDLAIPYAKYDTSSPFPYESADLSNFTNNQRTSSNGFVNSMRKNPGKTAIAIAVTTALSIALPIITAENLQDELKDSSEREADAKTRENETAKENNELSNKKDELEARTRQQDKTIKQLQYALDQLENDNAAARQYIEETSEPAATSPSKTTPITPAGSSTPSDPLKTETTPEIPSETPTATPGNTPATTPATTSFDYSA